MTSKASKSTTETVPFRAHLNTNVLEVSDMCKWMHWLASNGMAAKYASHLVGINVIPTDADKFPELREATEVWIVYDETKGDLTEMKKHFQKVGTLDG